MDSLQNELNRGWLNMVLAESLRQWNDFKEDRKGCTMEDFVEFTKEIAEGIWEYCGDCFRGENVQRGTELAYM